MNFREKHFMKVPKIHKIHEIYSPQKGCPMVEQGLNNVFT